MQRASASLPVRLPAAARGPRERAGPAGSERAGGERIDLAEALLAVVPDGVAAVAPDGTLVRWSPAAARLSGRSPAVARRLGFAALFQRPADVRRVLAAALARPGLVETETLLRHAEGREVPVRLRAVALPAGPPGPVPPPRAAAREEGATVLVLLEDRSEVHTIRRRLIETEKLSAMAKIAASIAHEFRNPLNSLFLSADLLEDELGEGGGESVTATLGAIREEIERLNQIITHYLALSKIGGTERQTIDLSRLASEFVAEQRERAAAQGVTLRLRTPSRACLVKGDVHQLRRVLLNLLENALDALRAGAAPGGEARRPGAVGISLRRFPGSVRLVLRDNGPGLAAGVREHPFEPFRSTKPRGTGLGLYLVREIVSAHGGTIGLRSGPSGGTRVAIRLPAAAAERGRARGRR